MRTNTAKGIVTISSLGLLRLGAEDFRGRVQAALA